MPAHELEHAYGSPGAMLSSSPPDGASVSNSGGAAMALEYSSDTDVVISGISARLPESDNMEEFRQHLMLGEDMVTEDDRRWQPGQKCA